MTFFTGVTQRLRQNDLWQSLLVILAVLVLTLAFSWPGAGAPNDSWSTVAQVRRVVFTFVAVGFGASAAAVRSGRLETLVALWLCVVLGLPIEAFAYAASYPGVPVWWFAAQPLLDVGAYFGIGLGLGRLTRRLPMLLPLVPLFVVAALFGLSSGLEAPLLNPFAGVQFSWWHLVVTALFSSATLILCLRGRIGNAD